MSQRIQNPEPTPAVKGPELNDRDLLNDILATAKYLMVGNSSLGKLVTRLCIRMS